MSDRLKKLLLITITFFGYYVAISLNISGTSIFLKSVGAQYLPFFLVGYSLFFSIFSLLNAGLSYKISASRQYSLLVMIVLVLLILAQLIGVTTLAGVLIMNFCGLFILHLTNLQLFNLIASILTPLQSKNFLPIINAFSNFGMIVGSFAFVFFQQWGSQIGFGFLGAGLIAILFLLIISMEIFFSSKVRFPQVKPAISVYSEVKSTAEYIFTKSNLFKAFALIMFFIYGLRMLTEFKYNATLSQVLSGDQLGQTLGYVMGIENIVLIIINTFILKKAIFKFGVINSLIFYPVIFLVTLVIATIFNFNYLTVIALYLVYAICNLSVVLIFEEQVLSLLPKEKSRSGYLLIKGLIYGLTSLFFSTLLLIYTIHLPWEKYLNSLMILVIALAFLFTALKVKKLYFEDIKTNLFKNNLYLKLRSIDLLAEKNYREKGENYLRRLLGLSSSDYFVKARVLFSLGIIGNYQTIADLINVLRQSEPKIQFAALQSINAIIKNRQHLNRYPVSKYLLLKAYEDLLLADTPNYIKLEIVNSLQYFELSEVIRFLEDHLASNDPKFIANIIETLSTFDDRAIMIYIKPFLNNPDLHVMSSAIVALWKFQDLRLNLLAKLSALLLRKDLEAISAALFLIGEIQAYWEKAYVLTQLKSPHLTIRHRALIALIKLGETSRVQDFIEAIVAQSFAENYPEMEFLLSSLRKMPTKTKRHIIHAIQQMPQEKVEHIVHAMEASKYAFSQELSELS